MTPKEFVDQHTLPPQLSLEMRLFIRFASWCADLKPNTIHYMICALIFLDVFRVLMMVYYSYATIKGIGP